MTAWKTYFNLLCCLLEQETYWIGLLNYRYTVVNFILLLFTRGVINLWVDKITDSRSIDFT
jgi:hypothetical protein